MPNNRATTGVRFAIYLAVSTAGASTLAPRDTHAFEVLRTSEDAAYHWEATTIRYNVAPSVSVSQAAAVRRAFDSYQAVFGTSRILESQPEGPRMMGDGISTVDHVSEWDPADGDVSRTVGLTLFVFEVSTGVVRDAEILLNADRFRFADEGGAFDTESVVLHEIGHLFGLDHTCGLAHGQYPSCFSVPDNPPELKTQVLEAVMAPTLAPSVQRRALTADELDGLMSLYPDDTLSLRSPLALTVTPTCGDVLELAVPELGNGSHAVTFRAPDGTGQTLVAGSTGGRIRLARSSVPENLSMADVIVQDMSSGRIGVAQDADLTAPATSVCEPAPTDTGCAAHGIEKSGLGATLLLILGALAVRRRRAALVAILVAATFYSVPAEAFRCSRVGVDFGPSLVWNTRSIPWVVDQDLTTDISDPNIVLQQLQLSFQAWEGPDCSDLQLPYQGQKPGLQAQFSETGVNENAVIFVKQNWPYESAIIAVTTNAFDTRTGIVFDSDIEINDEFFTFVDAPQGCNQRNGEMDLRNAVTHEVGHVIGLDHPPLTPRFSQATMYASAPSCETIKRDLDADDIEGLCSIYPSGRPFQQCFAPQGQSFLQVDSDDGFGCSHTRPGKSSWVVGFLVAIAVILRRRRA